MAMFEQLLSRQNDSARARGQVATASSMNRACLLLTSLLFECLNTTGSLERTYRYTFIQNTKFKSGRNTEMKITACAVGSGSLCWLQIKHDGKTFFT